MRILSIPDQLRTPTPIASVAAAPTVDSERVAALERVAQSLREKIRDLEQRLQVLEQAPKTMPVVTPAAPVFQAAPPPASLAHVDITLDAEAIKKNLLAKMWKYLHDNERPAKAV